MNDDCDCATTRDLNFKVPATFHKQFKVWAAMLGIEMRELLFNMTGEFQKKNPKLPKIH